ncbi:MAG: hypothetical protein IAE96_09680 [Chitinophagaceae bacterium]|nr:hypothetical protein [Chitinophagaceae bacterium]
MASFILFLVSNHQKRQMVFHEFLKQTQTDYEKNLIQTQLEIQEQTFQHISREIHDHINLSLTLAKLQLNTFDWNEKEKSAVKLDSSISLLTNSIAELSDISRSLNADLIGQQGLLKALEEEMQRIRQTELFTVKFEVTGTPFYLDSNKELIIFRIIQEAFNNIIKHSRAGETSLELRYQPARLMILVSDNGRGFTCQAGAESGKAGLRNMETRIRILNGQMQISSNPEQGTCLCFTIPIESYE